MHTPLRLPCKTTSDRPKVFRTRQFFLHFSLGNALRATTARTFSSSQLPKVVREWCPFYVFTWKCASRHNGVHFVDSASSKSAPNLVCFGRFDFQMCFAPPQRALFRHRRIPKVLRTWCALDILTSKCASRHNRVHFFDIAASKSDLKLKCFAHFDFQTCFAPQRRAIVHVSSDHMPPHPPL